MQKGSKFCHELTIEECLKGEKSNLWASFGLLSLCCYFPHGGCFTSWSSYSCRYPGQQSSPCWDFTNFTLMQITPAHSWLASLNLRGIVKAKFASFSLLFLVRKESVVTAFWGYPAEKKVWSVDSKGESHCQCTLKFAH